MHITCRKGVYDVTVFNAAFAYNVHGGLCLVPFCGQPALNGTMKSANGLQWFLGGKCKSDDMVYDADGGAVTGDTGCEGKLCDLRLFVVGRF